MRSLVIVVVLVLSLVRCSGSTVNTQATIADQIGRTANQELPVMVAAYRAEGDRAIAAAPDRPAAVTGLATVRSRWSPVWSAWDALRAALGAYADVLERVSGGSSTTAALVATLPAVRAAWCVLVRAVPTGALPSVPAVTGLLCP